MVDRLLRLCAGLAGAILAAIVAGITLNVVLRNILGQPIFGLLDLVEYGLLVVTLLGAPWVLSRNAHVVVDLVTASLPAPLAGRVSRAVACLGLAVSVIMVWYGAKAAITSYGRGSVIRTAFDVPEWWVLSVLPVAFSLMAAEFLRQVIRPARWRDTRSGL